MSKTIYDLFQQCTARINIPGEHGTGFFVYPGALLSCAHVVKQASTEKISIYWQGMEYHPSDVSRVSGWDSKTSPYCDLVLLTVPISDHPCVDLMAPEDSIQPGDYFYSYGYPDVDDSLHIKYSGPRDSGRIMTLEGELIRGGFSGAPLLHIESFQVCGLIKSELAVRQKSGDRALGGRGISACQAYVHFPDLYKQNQAFHRGDQCWQDAIVVTQRKQENQAIQQAQASDEQNFAQLLATLNFCQQKRVFEDVQCSCLELQQCASAFVVRADPDLHRWLVWSLLQSIDGLMGAKFIPATGNQLRRRFGQFWDSLSGALELSGDVSNDQILDGLCDRLKTQSVVMVVNNVDEAKQVLPAFRDQFWLPLLAKLNDRQDERFSRRKSFRLLMITPEDMTPFSDYDWQTARVEPGKLDNLSSAMLQYPLELEVLHIRGIDVQTWLNREAVNAFLRQQVGDVDGLNSMSTQPSSDAYVVLDEIAKAFKFKGFEAIPFPLDELEVGV